MLGQGPVQCGRGWDTVQKAGLEALYRGGVLYSEIIITWDLLSAWI